MCTACTGPTNSGQAPADVAAATTPQDAQGVAGVDAAPTVDTPAELPDVAADVPQATAEVASQPDTTAADSTAAPDSAVADAAAPDSAAPADTIPLPACTTASDCPSGLCTVAACTPTGLCITLPQPDGAACTSGNACAVASACTAGQCQTVTPLICDDEQPCTTDKCNPLSGCINLPVAASTACDDGNPCTVGDGCQQGSCQSGEAICQCQKSSDCGKFEDGNACNGKLYCDKSQGPPYLCKLNPATLIVCSQEQDNACLINKCLPTSGECQLIATPTNTVCSDGNACTTGDTCQSGLCLGGTNTCTCKTDSDCAGQEDGNLCNGKLFCNKATGNCALNKATAVYCPSVDDTFCRQNLCSPASGKCLFANTNLGKSCDDGNSCTASDTCITGTCAGSGNLCVCQNDADCVSKEDGNVCNGTLYCDVATKNCVVNPATQVVCATASDSPCAPTLCNPQTGKCGADLLAKAGAVCDDGNPCTSGEKCGGGQCAGGQNLCACQSNGDCQAKEDGDLCNGTLYCDKASNQCVVNPATVVSCPSTFDTTCLTNQCDGASGKCSAQPAHQGNACSDGALCSAGGWCALGSCAVEVKVACECLQDSDCAKLEDGNLCNGSLYCDKSASKPLCKLNPATVVVCKSVNDTPCAKNLCVPSTGQCSVTATAGACDDGKVCTVQDACQVGACTGAPKSCADSQLCTVDSCQEPFGCMNLPASATVVCDDANPCTVSDSCAGGACVGAKLVCDDANVCTSDACSGAKGCVFGINTAGCSDGDACTANDSCVAGVCKAGAVTNCDDGNLCTTDSCTKTTGGCAHVSASAVTCTDNNPCTDDSCDAVLGCSHSNNTGKCSDANPCTGSDLCSGGNCSGGPPVICNDGKVCTDDSCDAKLGCSFVANTLACDDGDACTGGEACKVGTCTGGTLKACDDKNLCTDDSCASKTGICSSVANSVACDDGNNCTDIDQCAGGGCFGQQAVCNDGNACTDDSCKPATGCTSSANVAGCSTGSCSFGDKCAAGLCVAGKASTYVSTKLVGNGGEPATTATAAIVFANSGDLYVGGKSLKSSAAWIIGGDGTVKDSTFGSYVTSAAVGFANVGGTIYGGFDTGQGDVYSSKLDAKGGIITPHNFKVQGNSAYIGHGAGIVIVTRYGAAESGFNGIAIRLSGNLSTIWGYSVPADKATYGDFLAVASSPDSKEMLAVGTSSVAGSVNTNGLAVRLSDAGVALSQVSFGGSKPDSALAVAAMPSGGYAVAGSTQSTGSGGADGWLVRIDKAGVVAWQRTFGTAAADSFGAIAVAGDGSILLGGRTTNGTTEDAWLVKTDAFGNLIWQKAFGGEAKDWVAAVLLLPDQSMVGTWNDNSANMFRRDAWGNASCAAAGACGGLSPAACADANPCTADGCAPLAGCTHTPLPAGAQCGDDKACDAKGKCTQPLHMAEVPAGKFWMGCASADTACAASEKPLHELALSAYFIDLQEVTVAAYAACVAATACVAPNLQYSLTTPTANYGHPARASYPVNGVDRSHAASYCAWRGKRLPTEAEWEKAARGGCSSYPNSDCKTAMPVYPWGNQAADCTFAVVKAGAAGCGSGVTAPTGGVAAGASPYGLLDMAGNVAEWVSDDFDVGYYLGSPASDPQGPAATGKAVLRGGSFSSLPVDVRASARVEQTAANDGTGFRCAKGSL